MSGFKSAWRGFEEDDFDSLIAGWVEVKMKANEARRPDLACNPVKSEADITKWLSFERLDQ